MPKRLIHIACIVVFMQCLAVSFIWAENPEDDLSRTFRLSKGKGTIYNVLRQITNQTGFMFIYDSEIIDNDKEVNIKTGTYTIREAVNQTINDPEIDLRLIRNHILLYKKDTNSPTLLLSEEKTKVETVLKDTFITISGIIVDDIAKKRVPEVSIGISNTSIGTISNKNGEFLIRIPESYRKTPLFFSHMGYEPLSLHIDAITDKQNTIILKEKVIPIQEVAVQLTNPKRLMSDMISNIPINYAVKPVYNTVFYREGVKQKGKLVSLIESVMKIYKAPYNSSTDQAKMLKMRKITNREQKDTLATRFKSGINTILMLDIIKHPLDFLQFDKLNDYIYYHYDITVINGRHVNVLAFELPNPKQPLFYKGEIYIDMETDALIEARFEVDPRYISRTGDVYIAKKSSDLDIVPEKITYNVSYKEWEGVYNVNYIRGDLHFKTKKKRQLFASSTPLHVWFEMINLDIEKNDVERFSRNERLETKTILADTKYIYDADFWHDFSIIPPEEGLTKAIGNISAKIEETY
jgi:hypothetical protein